MVHTIWMARHGNRQDFVDPDWMKRADRPYDPGLSADGEIQAQQLARRLQHEDIDALFASPFLRSVGTANHVAEALDLPIYIEPGLSEWLNVEWFPETPLTLSAKELARRFPRIDASYRPLGEARYGESESEAMRRSAEAAHAIARHCSGSVLLVGHSVSVIGAAGGLYPGARIPECGLCCIFKFVGANGAWRMAICADSSHLQERAAANY